MSVRLRLRRMGRKKRPFYRIVAADQRAPRDGRFIESLGYYNPLDKPHTVEVKENRVLYWLANGAQPSNTVKSLLSREGIMLKFDLQKRGLDQDEMEEEIKKWELLQAERSKRKEAVAVQKQQEEEKIAAEEAAKEKEAAEAAEKEAQKAAQAAAAKEAEEASEEAAPAEDTQDEPAQEKESNEDEK